MVAQDANLPTARCLQEHLRTEIRNQGLEDFAQVVGTGCFGFCEKGPIVKIIPDNTFYTQVKPEDAKEIVEEHIVKGRRVSRLLYKDPKIDKIITDSKGMEFYKKQMRIALRNCGVIDPENIDEYIARDGYAALGKVLTSMTPVETIEVIKKSGTPRPRWCRISDRIKMGDHSVNHPEVKNMWYVMQMRVTPVHLWTVPSWKAIRTA